MVVVGGGGLSVEETKPRKEDKMDFLSKRHSLHHRFAISRVACLCVGQLK